jgi:hypothetical protein
LQEKEAYIEYGENVTIDKLESNTAYELKSVDSLDIIDYNYDINDPSLTLTLPETHIVVYCNSNFTITIPSGSFLRDGDSLTLDAGNTYLITVKCNFWKVELYQ